MITYLKGDATYPKGLGIKLLCHIVNDKGAWGSGFVLALSKRWKEPEMMYRMMPVRTMGMIQTVSVEDDIIVVNMIAQTLWKKGQSKSIPLNYAALDVCLKKVNKIAVEHKLTVHAPRFGSGLAGGSWEVIEQMINEIITVPVTIYDYD